MDITMRIVMFNADDELFFTALRRPSLYSWIFNIQHINLHIVVGQFMGCIL